MLKMDKDRWASIKTTSKSTFDKSWTTGKKGFDKGWKALDKLGAPVNKLSNKLGSEAFWPMTLDKESEKAARILKAFIGGEDQGEPTEPTEGVPQGRQRVAKHIPPSVIANAKAIAIFTACRTGFWVSSAGGAGVLIKRLQPSEKFESIDLNDDAPPKYTETLTPPRTPDSYKSAYWSPPSGILLHTAALGFLAGADIYDCVMVLNTDAAVEAFTNPRLTLGAEVSVAAGPYSLGGVLDQNIGGGVRHLNEIRKRNTSSKDKEALEEEVEETRDPQKTSTWNKIKDERPVWSYLKSRGLYFGLGQLDGSIVIERTDENARFYNSDGVKVKQILAGNVNVPSPTTEEGGVYALWETLDAVVEASSSERAMSGIVARARKVFVRPKVIAPVDDDPFGIHALEKSGIHLIEAGTHRRINSEEFDRIFPPSPNTPTSLRERSRSRSRSPSPPALPQRSESLRLPSPPPLPKRSESLRTAKPGRWSTDEAVPTVITPATKEDNDCLDEEFENIPLRNDAAIKRAEKEIKEWEKQAEERDRKEREARRARMKRLSHEGALERIVSNDTIFDFADESHEKEREKRRSTYHM